MEDQLPDTTDSLNLSHLNATICAELAAGLAKPADIRKKYGITKPQWDRLVKTPAFVNMLKDSISRYSGDINAGRRITIKAETALEDSILVLHSIIHDKNSPANARVDGIKTMAQLAQRNQKAGSGGAGSGSGFDVQIFINTGQEKEVTIDAQAVKSTPQLESEDGVWEDSSAA